MTKSQVMTTATARKRELVKELRRWYGNLGPMDNWTIGQIENLLASAREHRRYFDEDYERQIRTDVGELVYANPAPKNLPIMSDSESARGHQLFVDYHKRKTRE